MIVRGKNIQTRRSGRKRKKKTPPERPGPRFSYQLVNHRPDQDLGSPDEWDEFITRGLRELFEKEPATRKARPSEHADLFDEFILFQARTMGWRLTLSRDVQYRMARWSVEETGPKRFEQLGKALGQSALIQQRRGRPPITDPDWYRGRKETVEELKLFFRQFGDFVRTKPGRLKVDQLKDWLSDRVQATTFPLLYRNLDSLLEYLQAGADGWTELLLAGAKISPSQFFDSWMGWRTGRDEEGLRQDISGIGSRKGLS